MSDSSKALAFIAKCEDESELKQLIANAKKKGNKDVENAAFRKLIALVPSERPGSLEHDFWQTVHAFEYALTEERGKTTRLSRTRQKVARRGVAGTLEDWAAGKPTDGFNMLIERGMPELTGEAIVLRHSDRFSPDTVSAARARLAEAGVNPDELAKM